jgi:protein TonB
MNFFSLRALLRRLGPATAAVLLLLVGCQLAPRPPQPPAPLASVPPAPPEPPPAPAAPAATPAPAAPAAPPAAATRPAPKPSFAATARDYRRDAAGHLYQLNADRIHSGRLPPMLYAIGVLQVELNARGQVLSTSWMRAPRHAPEVIAEIERLVREAAPFPPPARLGRVTYTDTWLWDKSGRFQLDTLTEGQD